MNLIRQLLLDLENDNSVDPLGYDEQNIAYHKALLVESGLAHGDVHTVVSGEILALVTRLTWEGHEFLDAARDETGWRRVTQVIGETVGTVSLSLLQKLLNQWAAQQFKTLLG